MTIKMSEVFKGTVRCVYTSQEAIQEVIGGEVFHLQDDEYHIASDEDHMRAAAHAINQHDKLVAENERLSLVVFDLLKTKALRGGSNSAEAAIYAKHELLDLLNRT